MITNFISWNCCDFNNKLDEIRDIISDHRPVCFALQERHLKKNEKIIMHSYISFRKDFLSSERATGGISLLISKDIAKNPNPLNTNMQAIAVQIYFQQLITVCSIYFY